MISIIPSENPVSKVHQILLGGISPRPICFASTIDLNGNRNLAPFSFFNVFSANPPIAIFSPALSGRTSEPKHTYLNVKEVPEVVINLVTYNMVQQMSLASSPYEKGVDEFVKSGFTPIDSDIVKPARVKESPIQLECKVIEVKELGTKGGAGNLIICEIVKIHIDETFLNEKGLIDQQRIDLVARMGENWYCRAHGDSLFELTKPITTCGIGVDVLPVHIRLSLLLTGNELGILGNLEILPSDEEKQMIKEKYLGQDAFVIAKNLILNNAAHEALALLW
ncbi:MAG: flavin reductase family protein [Bacteroidetes bacterium]|nr:flavin reductase family protein [Bacteroidota bacterium]